MEGTAAPDNQQSNSIVLIAFGLYVRARIAETQSVAAA
jgi:hypothetical protein